MWFLDNFFGRFIFALASGKWKCRNVWNEKVVWNPHPTPSRALCFSQSQFSDHIPGECRWVIKQVHGIRGRLDIALCSSWTRIGPSQEGCESHYFLPLVSQDAPSSQIWERESFRDLFVFFLLNQNLLWIRWNFHTKQNAYVFTFFFYHEKLRFSSQKSSSSVTG